MSSESEPQPEPDPQPTAAENPEATVALANQEKRKHERNVVTAMVAGFGIGILGMSGLNNFEMPNGIKQVRMIAICNELFRERFIADAALHERSISQSLDLSNEDFARIAHAQLKSTYGATVEGMRTAHIEDKEITSKLLYLEESVQALESVLEDFDKKIEGQKDSEKKRGLVHALGTVRHASLQTAYAMYRMATDRQKSNTDPASQQLLATFENLHTKTIILFERAFAMSDVYPENFEVHNLHMLKERKARVIALVNQDMKSFWQLSSVASLQEDLQFPPQKGLAK